MTELEQAQAKIKALEADNSALKSDKDKLQSQVANFEEADKQRNKDALAARVDKLIDGGFLLPAQKDQVLAFCENLDASQTIDFGEGDGKKSENMVDAYLGQFNKKVVNFDEQSGEQGDAEIEQTPAELSRKVADYQEEQREKGRNVDFVTALHEVKTNQES